MKQESIPINTENHEILRMIKMFRRIKKKPRMFIFKGEKQHLLEHKKLAGEWGFLVENPKTNHRFFIFYSDLSADDLNNIKNKFPEYFV